MGGIAWVYGTSTAAPVRPTSTCRYRARRLYDTRKTGRHVEVEVNAVVKHLCISFLAFLVTLSMASTHAQPTELGYFGLHMHRADGGSPWPSFPFGSWRLWDAYVSWAHLEPERGRWNFQRLDRYVELAEAHKIEITLTLGLTPAWASARPAEKSGYKVGNAAEPADFADWRRYVRTVAERYRGRIRYYEIWNEPSDRKFFTGTPDVLVRMIYEAHVILKQVDASNSIISPGNAGASRHIEYLDDLFRRGVKDYIDIVGYHFYAPNAYPEAIVPLIRAVKQLMKKHGIEHKPLWNTETGWWIENKDGTPDHPGVSSGGWRRLESQTEAGAVIARAFILARAEGVERFFWYSWDNPYGLGMLEPTSGVVKPIAAAYSRVVKWLVGMTVEPCHATAGVWVCALRSIDGAKNEWLVWSDSGTREWQIPNYVRASKAKDLGSDADSLLRSMSVTVGPTPIKLIE